MEGLIFGILRYSFIILLLARVADAMSAREDKHVILLSRPPLLPSLVFVNSKTDRSAPPPFMNTAFIPHVSNAHVLMSIAYLTLNISFAPATYAPNDFTFTSF